MRTLSLISLVLFAAHVVTAIATPSCSCTRRHTEIYRADLVIGSMWLATVLWLSAWTALP